MASGANRRNTERDKRKAESTEQEFERLRREDEDAGHPSGPAGIPPGHILIGDDSPLGENPVRGSVVSEDWGTVPMDPDVEEPDAFELEDETVI